MVLSHDFESWFLKFELVYRYEPVWDFPVFSDKSCSWIPSTESEFSSREHMSEIEYDLGQAICLTFKVINHVLNWYFDSFITKLTALRGSSNFSRLTAVINVNSNLLWVRFLHNSIIDISISQFAFPSRGRWNGIDPSLRLRGSLGRSLLVLNAARDEVASVGVISKVALL